MQSIYKVDKSRRVLFIMVTAGFTTTLLIWYQSGFSPLTDGKYARNLWALDDLFKCQGQPDSPEASKNTSRELDGLSQNDNILDLDPWDPSLREFLKPALDPDKDLNCSLGREPLTSSCLNEVYLHRKLLTKHEITRCCYQTIHRIEQHPSNYTSKADKLYRLSRDCYSLDNDVTALPHDSIMVNCYSHNESVYKNIHHLINKEPFNHILTKWKVFDLRRSITCQEDTNILKSSSGSSENSVNNGNSPVFNDKSFGETELPDKEKESEGRNSSEEAEKIPYSVIIFGLDSMSRSNMRRFMPQTFKLLQNKRALDLRGFNKVADNTYPNLVAVLSGKSGSWMDKNCIHHQRSRAYDNCSFIWKDFSRRGYLTVYGEDAPAMGIFHYNRVGFVLKPTHLYLRPFFLASEKYIGHGGRKDRNAYGEYCQGPRSSFDVIRDYCLDVERAMGGRPHFGLFWTARLTHDHSHYASLVDRSASELIRQVSEGGDFKNTFFFFMSDHGMRFGGIRKTKIGKMEESLPFAFVLPPKDFKNKHPLAYGNLVTNQGRLTSHFDIHATFWDILQQNYSNNEYISKEHKYSKSMPPGMSLFRVIPATRNCLEAAIPLHYCTTLRLKSLSVLEATHFVLDFLNRGLKRFPKCVQFEDHTLRKAWEGRLGTDKAFVIQFQTSPGNALMEATVVENTATHHFRIEGEVSRINKYKDQSSCIKDDLYRKYCYCKSLLKGQPK
ncbi:uncharacterized protein LOC143040300 [Oratosquilla oratoria]|uniref:uncharacterized protein LOC143040300 n=1 Tax=Oratosquilla oratoria TaxID=337810 RepID=UPI003F7703A7